MSLLARNGMVDLALTAGQSVVIGSLGAGQTKVYTAAPVVGQLPLTYVLAAVLSGASSYTTYAAATNVRIEASGACDVEYDFGAQPSLIINPSAGTTGLTAFAGGGQGSATLLTGSINRVTVCATAADSVKLPAAVVGRRVSLYNAGAASCNVFPQTGEAINSGAANAAFAVATTKGAIFECAVAGTWHAVLSA